MDVKHLYENNWFKLKLIGLVLVTSKVGTFGPENGIFSNYFLGPDLLLLSIYKWPISLNTEFEKFYRKDNCLISMVLETKTIGVKTQGPSNQLVGSSFESSHP